MSSSKAYGHFLHLHPVIHVVYLKYLSSEQKYYYRFSKIYSFASKKKFCIRSVELIDVSVQETFPGRGLTGDDGTGTLWGRQPLIMECFKTYLF